jgi:hypothetical protein
MREDADVVANGLAVLEDIDLEIERKKRDN